MVGTEVAAWFGVGALTMFAIVGWVVTAVRNGKSSARSFGRLEEKVDGVKEEIINFKTSINLRFDSYEKRLDKLDESVHELDEFSKDILRRN